MPDFEAIMKDFAANSAIAFIDLNQGKLGALGSGVLVSVGDVRGVLTCGHVFESIFARDAVGLCIFTNDKTRLQNAQLHKKDIGIYECLYQGESPEGPDIAFFEIANPSLFDSLAAATMVFDLVGGKSKYKTVTAGDDKKIYVVPGILGEWTGTVDFEAGMSLEVEGLSLVVSPRDPRSNKGYDLLTLVPSYDELVSAPASYGGLSGSGLWEILVREDRSGDYEFSSRKLSGVVFWEKPEGENDLIVFCHGPKSIYELLLPKVIQKIDENSIIA